MLVPLDDDVYSKIKCYNMEAWYYTQSFFWKYSQFNFAQLIVKPESLSYSTLINMFYWLYFLWKYYKIAPKTL